MDRKISSDMMYLKLRCRKINNLSIDKY